MPTREAVAEVARLRAQLERVQARRLDVPMLPVLPPLAPLLPGGGLRPGAAYSVAEATTLLLALLARPTQEGAWCAVVGVPGLGIEAAAQLGVDLTRLVLIPDPGPRWLAVTAAVADVLPVVAVRPAGRVGPAEVARLAARLREKQAVLLVQGAWPQAEAVLDVDDAEWDGIGDGHGRLRRRALTVTAAGRRFTGTRRVRMLMPDEDGGLATVATRADRPHMPMRAVG